MLLLWLVHAFAWTLCCFDDLGAVLCESSCFFRQVGHASALTLRFDSLVPSRVLISVVNPVYSLELLRVWFALVRLVVVVRAVAWTFRAFARVFSELYNWSLGLGGSCSGLNPGAFARLRLLCYFMIVSFIVISSVRF